MRSSSTAGVLVAAALLVPVAGAAQQDVLALSGGGATVDRTVAVVGDSVILASEIQEQILRLQAQGVELPNDPVAQDSLRRELLQSLITEQLVIQAAIQDTTLTVEESRIDDIVEEEVQRRMQAFGSEAAMREALSSQGMTMSTFREMIRSDARRQHLQNQFMARLEQRDRTVPVSEEELRAFFEENRDRLGPREASVTFEQIILRPTPADSARDEARARAEDVLEMLRTGEGTFDELAREYSEDPGTRDEGGDLGFFRRGQMVPAFEEVAFSLREGETSGIVETPFGFHIIRVERIRSGERRARHILIRSQIGEEDIERARVLAEEVAQQLQDGVPFDSLQERYGDPEQPDSLTVPVNRLAQLPPGYEEALSDAEPGEVVGPVEWGPRERLSISVIRVEERREAGEYTYEDLLPRMRETLQRQKMLDQLIEDLRARSHVEIFDVAGVPR